MSLDRMAESGPPLLEVTELAKHFDVSPPLLDRLLSGERRRVLRAVDGVSFAIRRGQTFSLVGESGCGKSTVARTVVGLYRPTAGRVRLDGVDLAASGGRRAALPQRRRMQMIFQDPYASLDPRWRAFDIIAEPLRTHRLAAGAALRRRVGELLERVGLTAADGRNYPHEFSGGQRQRIAIARALASGPDLLVCDEPTSALDVSVQAQILNLMQDLQQALGLTCLFISHNLAVVWHVSDMVGVMYLGRLVEWGDKRRVFRFPRHPYTRLLLDTIPDLTLSGRERHPVAGEVPNPLAPPSGCPFHPRCPHAAPRCAAERPEPVAVEGGGEVACHAVAEGRLPAEDRWAAAPAERV